MQTFSTVAGYRPLPTLHQYFAAGREQSPGSAMGTGSGTRGESQQGAPGTESTTGGTGSEGVKEGHVLGFPYNRKPTASGKCAS